MSVADRSADCGEQGEGFVVSPQSKAEALRVLMRLPEGTTPVDLDLDFEVVVSGRVFAAAGEPRDPLVVLAQRCVERLRERDDEVASWRSVALPLFELSEAVYRNADERVVRDVWATVYKDQAGRLEIPLGFPIDHMLFRFARGLERDDFVRFLSELVRVFSNAVRFVGLDDGLRRGAVRNLDVLVALLREGVGADAQKDTQAADECREHDSSPVGVSSPFKNHVHVASVATPVRETPRAGSPVQTEES